jgi:hypothetical protein
VAPSSRLLIPILILAALAACKTTPATMVSTWRNPAFTDVGFEDLFVIGVGENNETRRLFEDTFAKVIVSEGSQAQASWRSLPQSEQLTDQQIRDAMEGGDFDGVLITTLVSVDEEQEFVPPSGDTAGAPAGGAGYYPSGTRNVRSSPGVGYYQSYNRNYLETHETGYYKTHTTYRFRTELYSVATGTMVWRGDSKTVNPKNRTDTIGSVAEAVTRELKSEKLIQ